MLKQMITLSCVKVGKLWDHGIREDQIVEIQVEAYVEKGLGLHKDLIENVYVLTHIKSGQAINKWKMNKQQAMQWLETAASMADWTGEVSFLSVKTAKDILEITRLARRIRGTH
jgi:uncharacterized membrane protein YcjF (UPF0283 family)